MLKSFLLKTVALSAMLALSLAHAQAGPLPSGVTCIGNCGTDGANGVVSFSPLGTSNYLYVSTNGGVTDAGEIAGVGGTNGSQLTTSSFTANAGDLLKFYFNYVTSDGAGYSDYAFAKLLNANDSLAATLFTSRTQPTGNTSPGFGLPANNSTLVPSTSAIIPGAPAWSELGASSGTCYSAGCGYTGWIESDYTITSSGTYKLTFGATNFGDTLYDSGLAIDGVTVAGVAVVPPTPAPEPASIALLGMGLLGLSRLNRRRSR